MVGENSNKEVGEIKIEKSLKVEKSLIYLIIAVLCFFFLMIIILFFGFIYLTEPDVLFSPPTIDSFLIGLNNSYEAVIGDESSVEEKNLINDFVFEFGDLKVLKDSESDDIKIMMIGIGESFENAPYLEYLKDNDSIAIYDSERDSLFIYSKDSESLDDVLDILNKDYIEYSSIKVNKGVIEELVI